MPKKNSAAPAPADVSDAERVDMNDPALTDAEAVARNLGMVDDTDTSGGRAEPAGEAA